MEQTAQYVKKGDCCNLVDRSGDTAPWNKKNVEHLKKKFRDLVEISVSATYNTFEAHYGLCGAPYAVEFGDVTHRLCVSDVKGYGEDFNEVIDKIVSTTWIKYHPSLNEDAEPDYDQPIDALPVVNAMAEVLAEQTAHLYYQYLLVQAGPFNGKD